jgi:xylose isomerase
LDCGPWATANSRLGAYSKKKAKALRSNSLDIEQHALKGLKYEKLDQLTTELLLGVR